MGDASRDPIAEPRLGATAKISDDAGSERLGMIEREPRRQRRHEARRDSVALVDAQNPLRHRVGEVFRGAVGETLDESVGEHIARLVKPGRVDLERRHASGSLVDLGSVTGAGVDLGTTRHGGVEGTPRHAPAASDVDDAATRRERPG